MSRTTNWSALGSEEHPLTSPASTNGNRQQARQRSNACQVSDEVIMVKNSADVTVTSTDIKAALSLQAALVAAIQIVIRISILNGDTADRLSQELLNSSRITQVTRQRTIIENSRGVNITTTDAQIAVNIQILIQLLLALIVELDIL